MAACQTLMEHGSKLNGPKSTSVTLATGKLCFLKPTLTVSLPSSIRNTTQRSTSQIAIPPRPPKLALIAGDAAHNLRSALDLLAWALYRRVAGGDGKHIYFPICETPEKYKAQAPGKVEGISATDVKAIDAIQPYGTGNDYQIGMESSSRDRNAGSMPVDNIRFAFDNSYARLPSHFFARARPTAVRSPRLIRLNDALARQLALDPEALASTGGIAILSGNEIAGGSEPIALAYAGHQFGHFVPQLGDGRAHLLGEAVDPDGVRWDLQLKGSGPTHFSRRGDGRAALGPVLREYLVSEAMAALGIPTTRALAAVTTGEQVFREVPLPGAILTRVAASHLRVGTFEYFAARNDVAATRRLADYAIERHYPGAAASKRPYRTFLRSVIERHADLVALWMLVGFIHGVMNTDNMSISGETIDYGPCAFMEAYDPDTVFSSIDQQGRYAYSNQPHAAHWNLTRLAESLLPLLVEEEGSEGAALAAAREVLGAFGPRFERARIGGFRQKIGLCTEQEEDINLIEDLLARMAANQVDFTLLFHRLCNVAIDTDGDREVRCLFENPAAYDSWATKWRSRLAAEPHLADSRRMTMRRANPVVIPRNHQVAAVIDAATRENLQPFEDLLTAVCRPYTEDSFSERYMVPATPGERVSHTFCGT